MIHRRERGSGAGAAGAREQSQAGRWQIRRCEPRIPEHKSEWVAKCGRDPASLPFIETFEPLPERRAQLPDGGIIDRIEILSALEDFLGDLNLFEMGPSLESSLGHILKKVAQLARSDEFLTPQDPLNLAAVCFRILFQNGHRMLIILSSSGTS